MGGRLRPAQQMEPANADGSSLGVGLGVWLLLAGIVLSCTGLGAVVGIPLVVLGLVLPAAGRSAAARTVEIASDDALYEPAPERPRRRGIGAGAGR